MLLSIRHLVDQSAALTALYFPIRLIFGFSITLQKWQNWARGPGPWNTVFAVHPYFISHSKKDDWLFFLIQISQEWVKLKKKIKSRKELISDCNLTTLNETLLDSSDKDTQTRNHDKTPINLFNKSYSWLQPPPSLLLKTKNKNLISLKWTIS